MSRAAMDGLDVLVFTGGIGEHLPAVRAAAAERLDFLGVRLDESANQTTGGIGSDAPVRTLVITVREDIEIAR